MILLKKVLKPLKNKKLIFFNQFPLAQGKEDFSLEGQRHYKPQIRATRTHLSLALFNNLDLIFERYLLVLILMEHLKNGMKILVKPQCQLTLY